MKKKFKVGDTIRILDTPNVRYFSSNNKLKCIGATHTLTDADFRRKFHLDNNRWGTNFDPETDFELVNQQISFNYLIL